VTLTRNRLRLALALVALLTAIVALFRREAPPPCASLKDVEVVNGAEVQIRCR
jgi:hypothetical protein